MAAALGGRRLILMDENPDAIRIMADRLAYARPLFVGMNCANGCNGKVYPHRQIQRKQK